MFPTGPHQAVSGVTHSSPSAAWHGRIHLPSLLLSPSANRSHHSDNCGDFFSQFSFWWNRILTFSFTKNRIEKPTFGLSARSMHSTGIFYSTLSTLIRHLNLFSKMIVPINMDTTVYIYYRTVFSLFGFLNLGKFYFMLFPKVTANQS